MDEIVRYNKQQWEALVQANVQFGQPWLDLDKQSALERLDPQGILNDVAGKKVLCLASGGGQQSAAFGLLGAQVTVVDLTKAQLEQDRRTAKHYGLNIETIEMDMRQLSMLKNDQFDIVWHGYSISFVPDVRPVFAEVARVIRPGGLYYLRFGNPFTHDSIDEEAWNGESYPLKFPYLDGVEITSLHPDWAYWDVESDDGESIKVASPKEFHHNFGTIVNNLIPQGFILLSIWEGDFGDLEAEPGSWEHFKAFAPPWLGLWARYQPEVFEPINTTPIETA